MKSRIFRIVFGVGTALCVFVAGLGIGVWHRSTVPARWVTDRAALVGSWKPIDRAKPTALVLRADGTGNIIFGLLERGGPTIRWRMSGQDAIVVDGYHIDSGWRSTVYAWVSKDRRFLWVSRPIGGLTGCLFSAAR